MSSTTGCTRRIVLPLLAHQHGRHFCGEPADDPMSIAPYVRAQIYAIDPSQPIDERRTLENLMDRYVYSSGRFRVWLMGVFAVLGLALSVVGVYGVLSQIVAIEQRNIGIRMAVGAGSREIVQFVMGRGARLGDPAPTPPLWPDAPRNGPILARHACSLWPGSSPA